MTGSLETMNDFGPKHILYTDPYRSKYVFSARKMALKSRPSTSAAASGALSGAGMLPKICSMLTLKVRATSPSVSGSPFFPAARKGMLSQNQSQMPGSGSGSFSWLVRICRASDLDMAIGMLLIQSESVGSSGIRSLLADFSRSAAAGAAAIALAARGGAAATRCTAGAPARDAASDAARHGRSRKQNMLTPLRGAISGRAASSL
mmetsp:Transcript_12331/g.40894  ORF Transcript_12331/g.40894 Transcript_12331/m.40894 type:complete len:205 (+) Transcript_12331:1832-2446(+)